MASPARSTFSFHDTLAFSPETWGKVETWKELKKLALNLSYDEETGDAGDLLETVDHVLGEGNFSNLHADVLPLAREVRTCLSFARFTIAIPEETLSLIQTKALYALAHEVDLRRKVMVYLRRRRDGRHDGKERHAMIRALRENTAEHIGGIPILVKGDTATTSSIVKNWLRDYEQFLESDEFKVRGAVDEVHYVNQNQNARKLTRDERTLLLQLLQLYDYLLFPQAQQESGERWGDMERERPVLPQAPLQPEERQVRSSPLAPPLPQRFFDDGAVLAASQSIGAHRNTTEDLLEGVANIFEPKSGGRPNRIELLGALRLLAERGVFGALLRDHRPTRERFEQLLIHQLRSDVLSGFRLNPTLPMYVSLFFQYVLVGRLGVGGKEGAEIIAGLLPLLSEAERTKYQKMVHYDFSGNQWDWT